MAHSVKQLYIFPVVRSYYIVLSYPGLCDEHPHRVGLAHQAAVGAGLFHPLGKWTPNCSEVRSYVPGGSRKSC